MDIVRYVKMKSFISFLLWSTLIYHINAQACIPVEDSHFNPNGNWYFNTDINDNHRGIVAEITVPGLTATSQSDSVYLEFSTPQDGQFTVSVTDEFQNFEENTATGSPTVIGEPITLTCGSSSTTITFVQNIIDINSAPVFSQSEYRYSLPMPFPLAIDITQFGNEIIARDIDTTATTITFEADSILFEFKGQGTVDSLNKNHKATLEPTRSLDFSEPMEFEITATDHLGAKATATVIIEVDTVNSVSGPPTFEHAYYEVEYNVDDTLHTASVTMAIEDAEDAEFTHWSDSYTGQFSPIITPGQVTVNLEEDINPEDVEDLYRIIVVTATVSPTKVGRTVILVKFPAPEPPTTAAPCEVCPSTTESPNCYEFCEEILDEICPTTPAPVDCNEYCEEILDEICPTTPAPVDCNEYCEEILDEICPTTPAPVDCNEYCEEILDEICPTTPAPVDCNEYCEEILDEICPTTPVPTDCNEYCEEICEDICPSTPAPVDCNEYCEEILDEICPSTPAPTDCNEYCEEILDEICPSTPVPDCNEYCEEICTTTAAPDCTEYCKDICSDPDSTACTTESSTPAPDCTEYCEDICSSKEPDCSECTEEICPDPDCSECTTEDICKECPTTPDPAEAVITFSRPDYEFTFAAFDSHCLSVSASSTIQESIKYTSTNLPDELDLDEVTGALTSTALLTSGIYEFTVTATGQTSTKSESANVKINILGVEICPDGPRTAYALIVRPVTEEGGDTSLLATDIDETYAFEIIDVSPPAGRDLFYVSEDGLTVGCHALDRESNHFTDMEVQQYTVTVRILEENEDVQRINFQHFNNDSISKRALTKAAVPQKILINDIENKPQQTVIAVIVEDINDNDPVFAETELVVGYPDRDLLSIVSPAYLTQVQATDADVGDNAELVYEVTGSLVIIHPETGVIYPTEATGDDDFTFVVTAQDERGEGRLSSNSLTVEVKILEEEYISVVTIRNYLLEDVSEQLSSLSKTAGVDIRQLQASVLPIENTRKTRADEPYYLIIIAYALDGDNNLVTSSTLQESLNNVENISILSLAEHNNNNNNTNDDGNDSSNEIGLIAAVSVLSVLLLLLLLGFFLFYYFKLRKSKTDYDSMQDENSSAKSTPPMFIKNPNQGRSSSKLSQIDAEKIERRPTGILITSPAEESDDSPTGSPPKERRKSVVFNNNVEQINIHTTTDNEENDNTKV